jgi:hypothetical protein
VEHHVVPKDGGQGSGRFDLDDYETSKMRQAELVTEKAAIDKRKAKEVEELSSKSDENSKVSKRGRVGVGPLTGRLDVP